MLSATQSVFHLHDHTVPRWKGDRMGDFWPGGEDASDDAQEALAGRIRQELARPWPSRVTARADEQRP